MNESIELGRRIREYRLKQGLSLSQLAAEVGRSSSSVRRWERGEVPPARSVMPALASALEVDESELDALRGSATDAVDEPAADEVSSVDTDPSSESDPPGPSTLEQPVVAPPADQDEPIPAQSTDSSPGIFGELVRAWRSLTTGWTGWIRGLATAGVLIVMAIILIWALGELFGALGEIWDSFDAETSS